MNQTLASALLAATLTALSGAATAAPVHVGVFAGGGFGGTAGGPNTAAPGFGSAFVNSGFQVQAGDQIQVTATGTVCLTGGGGCAGADGQVLASFGLGTIHYTAVNNLFGALLGAIVADDSGAFQAFDASDVTKGIDLASVLTLGSNMTFTASSAGRLYLGVSDSAFWDNGGTGFDVSLVKLTSSHVPEPASMALLALAGAAACLARRRARR